MTSSTSASSQGPARATQADRVGAGAVAAACLGVLAIAAFLPPAAEGHGTHESMGLPACAWPAMFDMPCPTCGMTTSFAHAANGGYLDALWAQPLGALLAVGTATAFWLSLHTLLFGSRLGVVATGLLGGRFLWAGAGALLGSWLFKLATW